MKSDANELVNIKPKRIGVPGSEFKPSLKRRDVALKFVEYDIGIVKIIRLNWPFGRAQFYWE